MNELLDVLEQFVKDNTARGLGGQNVNWALIHRAAMVIKQAKRREAESQ
jgi:hypothetical protein